MEITREIVERTAELSCLRFDNVEEFIEEFDKIVAFVEQIQELKLEDVQPLYWPGSQSCSEREDKIIPPLSRKEALDPAEETIDEFFQVPRIL